MKPVSLLLYAALGAGLVSAAMGNTTNVIVYQEPFEETYQTGGVWAPTGYTNTQSVLGSFGWYGTAVEALITNDPAILYKLTNEYTLGYPIETNHTKVLFTRDGTLTNEIDSGLASDVYVDFMLCPIYLEDGDRPANDTTAQIIFYVNTNGLLVSWMQPNVEEPPEWRVLTNSPVIPSNEWCRVTIDWKNDGDTGYLFYSLRVNGSEPLTDDWGYDLGIGGHPGKWMTMGYQASTKISQVEISGYTYLDDLVVTTAEPTFPDQFKIVANAHTGGKLNGVAGIQTNYVAEGHTKTYFVAGDGDYTVDYVEVDGTNQGAIASYTFTDVQTDHAIDAYFKGAYVITPSVGGITPIAGGHGTIDPSTNIVVEAGSNATFTITADKHYHIQNIETNGDQVADYAGLYGSKTFTNVLFTWVNITANGTVDVGFAEDLWASNTPGWYIAAFYPAASTTEFDAIALSDDDDDGYEVWQEKMFGGDPLNGASTFEIVAQGTVGASNYVQWLYGTNANLDIPFDIYASTNLPAFIYTGSAARAESPTTAIVTGLWWDVSPKTDDIFYEVRATNAPAP